MTARADGKVFVIAPHGAEAYIPRHDGMDGWGPYWLMPNDGGGLADMAEDCSDFRAAIPCDAEHLPDYPGVWLDPAEADTASVLRRVVEATAKAYAVMEAFEFVFAIAAPTAINVHLRRFSRYAEPRDTEAVTP